MDNDWKKKEKERKQDGRRHRLEKEPMLLNRKSKKQTRRKSKDIWRLDPSDRGTQKERRGSWKEKIDTEREREREREREKKRDGKVGLTQTHADTHTHTHTNKSQRRRGKKARETRRLERKTGRERERKTEEEDHTQSKTMQNKRKVTRCWKRRTIPPRCKNQAPCTESTGPVPEQVTTNIPLCLRSYDGGKKLVIQKHSFLLNSANLLCTNRRYPLHLNLTLTISLKYSTH